MFDMEFKPQNASAGLAGRWDLYGPVHKGLRLAHGEVLRRLGAADWSTDQGVLIGDLRAHLALGAKHLEHEEAHIHGAMARRRPDLMEALEGEHAHHRARFAVVEAQIASLETGSDADLPMLGRAVYLAMSQLVAEDLAHMHHEETVVWPGLCAAFTDEEMQAMEMAIISALAPDEVIAFMRLMIPAMDRAERTGLLTGMKAGAPPEAFAAVLDLAARPTLDPGEWEHLVAVGVAA